MASSEVVLVMFAVQIPLSVTFGSSFLLGFKAFLGGLRRQQSGLDNVIPRS